MRRIYVMLLLLLASTFVVTPAMAKGKRADKRAERKNKRADRKSKDGSKSRPKNAQTKKDIKGAIAQGERINGKWEDFQASDCGPALKSCGNSVMSAFPSGPACKAFRICRKGCRKAKRTGKRSCKTECKGKRGKAKRQCKKSCRREAKGAKNRCFSQKCGARPDECKLNLAAIGSAIGQCAQSLGASCGQQLKDIGDEANRFAASAKAGGERRKTRSGAKKDTRTGRKDARKSGRKNRRGK